LMHIVKNEKRKLLIATPSALRIVFITEIRFSKLFEDPIVRL